MKIDIPETNITLEDLEDIESAEERTKERPQQLPPRAIVVASEAFQPRLIAEDRRASEDHIRDLARALERGDVLPPLLVTPVGQRFFLVDGHHRLGAYKAVGWKRPITVEMFEGSVREAHVESIVRNNKNKLPMSKNSRYESAWKLVQAGPGAYSKSEIEGITGVSEGTISAMRRVWKEHRQRAEGRLWSEVRSLQFQTHEEAQADWRDQKVEQIAERMRKSGLGGELMKRPDIFADALEVIDAELPRKLCEYWLEIAKEVAERAQDFEELDI